MKKFLILFVLITITVSLAAIVFANTAVNNSLFDVKNTRYEEAVNGLVSKGIINGYLDKTFRPDNKITRAEMAKILVMAANLNVEFENKKNAEIFPDVAKNHWAISYVNIAYKNDYIEGHDNGMFEPDANVTYAEAITMVVRMLGYKSTVESKGTWPDNYIKKAQNLKILSDVDFKNKNDDATRGNIANLVWNALNETKTYYKAGILEDANIDKLGDSTIKIDGNEYTFRTEDNGKINIEEYLNSAIFYKLKQEKDEGYVTFISALTVEEILVDNYDDYVEASADDKTLFENRGVESFKETFEDDFDDYIFVKFNFDVEEKAVSNIVLVTTNDKIKASDFEEFDRVYIDDKEEIVFIIEGFEEKNVQ